MEIASRRSDRPGSLKGMADLSKHKDLWLAEEALFIVVAVVALIIGYTGVRELQYANHIFDGQRVDDLQPGPIFRPV
jgi:hypothetical protein